ncbi:MAG: hypothetical protein ACXVCY_13465 [Pseudobdellovibrionaceae bacterium]
MPSASATTNGLYVRYSWRALETSQGVYDFSAIDHSLSLLTQGQRLSFRIYALNNCFSNYSGQDVPNYLVTGKGWWTPITCTSAQTQVYVPDWNDSTFLTATTNLLTALGARYNNDPRIGWIDIGIFGDWGEWHIAEYPYCDSNHNILGATQATSTSLHSIISAHVQAFPQKQLVLAVTPYVTPDNGAPVLLWALGLNTTIPIGLRKDSWGSNWWNQSWNVWQTTTGTLSSNGTCTTSSTAVSATDLSTIMSRWRSAPLVVENYGGSKSFEVGASGLLAQIQNCHAACIENGSWAGPWSSLSATNQNALISSGLAAGYRLLPAAVTITPSGTSSISVAIASTWKNFGVSPTYDNWKVTWSLVSVSAGTTLISFDSSIDLRQVLPIYSYGNCATGDSVSATGTGEQLIVTDTMTLPTHSSGDYYLKVKVTDPNSYLSPMALYLQGSANSDGSYTLGTVSLP